MYNIVFYTAERGDSPLDDFLIDLAEKRMEDWMRRFPAGGEI